MHQPLNLAWVSFWNLWPMRCELQRIGHINFFDGTPSQVNRLLLEGKVAAAPGSSICLALQSNLEIALPLGVVANGAVQSVYLGFKSNHRELLQALKQRQVLLKSICQKAMSLHKHDTRTTAINLINEIKAHPPIPPELYPGLRLCPSSASGACLAKIFMLLCFGEKTCNRTLPSDKRTVDLLIGDNALSQRNNYYQIIDLGSFWKDMTKLPFVFAVWQSHTKLSNWKQQILKAGELAERRMRVEPSSYLPDIPPRDCHDKEIPLGEYWKHIYYHLGPEELKGLLLFLCLARGLKLAPKCDQVTGKILRWQELTFEHQLTL